MVARRRFRPTELMESLESRTLMSASYAVLVLQGPTLPQQAVQTDVAPAPTPAGPSTATFNSVLDAQVRTVPGGIYLSISASSTEVRPETPTGTVDIYEGLRYLTTVQLGGSLRSSLVLPAGTHTILVTYKGDANFLPSQTAVLARLDAPTSTPVTLAESQGFAKNNAGERIRPMRFLSRVNYFDAHGLTVAAIPQAAQPTSGNETTTTTAASSAPPPQPLPAQRYANLTFSVKLPRIRR